MTIAILVVVLYLLGDNLWDKYKTWSARQNMKNALKGMENSDWSVSKVDVPLIPETSDNPEFSIREQANKIAKERVNVRNASRSI